MTEIGVVGAGAASAATTYTLSQEAPDANVTVLEKSGGLCGRAATRRKDAYTYDYGANYLKDDDERVTELVTETLDTAGLIDIPEPIYTFDESGTVSPGRDADDHKWTYRAGLTQIAKRLFGRTDAEIQRRTRIEHLRREAGSWFALDTDGTEWGPFDVLLLNPPAPQTGTLLQEADWESGARQELVGAIESVEYRTIWTAVLQYPFELDVPYYGLVNTDKNHEVGWLSREECKPDHVPDGNSLLIVQANDQWSRTHYDADPAQNVGTLANHAAEIIGDERLREPGWTDHQGWRYALPENGVDTEPLRAAEDENLYCLGDWVAGDGRIHAALANGLDTGQRLTERL